MTIAGMAVDHAADLELQHRQGSFRHVTTAMSKSSGAGSRW